MGETYDPTKAYLKERSVNLKLKMKILKYI